MCIRDRCSIKKTGMFSVPLFLAPPATFLKDFRYFSRENGRFQRGWTFFLRLESSFGVPLFLMWRFLNAALWLYFTFSTWTEFWIYCKPMLDAQYIPNSVHLDTVKYCFQTLEVATMLGRAANNWTSYLGAISHKSEINSITRRGASNFSSDLSSGRRLTSKSDEKSDAPLLIVVL